MGECALCWQPAFDQPIRRRDEFKARSCASAYPYSALGVLVERASIPAGVLNILTGWLEVIRATLTASPTVRKLSFTGSTCVSALLAVQCAPTMKKMSLELGGNAPFIVFDDADLDAAVEGAMVSKFRNGGQTCVSANRILAQSGIHDEFVAALTARDYALTVGTGTAESTAIGPMINAHIDDALEVGLVGLNTGAVSHAKAPFGGVKSLGLGREGAQERDRGIS